MKIELPRFNNKTWIAAWSLLFVICSCAGILTRVSFSNYNTDRDRLDDLLYQYNPATPEVVNLTPETAHSLGMISNEDLIDQTPIIVSGVFDNDRLYAYQSFVSEVRITEVFKGNGITAGQTIPIFEPVRIKNTELAKGADTQRVLQPSAGMFFYGATMMKEGQEYLFFLSPKIYPDVADREGRQQEYVLQNNPYARLALSQKNSAEDIAILDPRVDQISLRESQEYSYIVLDSGSQAQYQKTRESMYGKVLELN